MYKMGGADYVTTFEFNVTKVSGQPVFTVYNVTGDSKVEYLSHTSTSVKFSLSDAREYVNTKVEGFNRHYSSTVSEYDTIRSSYTVEKGEVNKAYVEIKLKPASSNVSSLSWSSMLSVVNPGFVTSCKVTVSTTTITKAMMNDSNSFRYITMAATNSIANNCVYVNQDEETVYFDNNSIPINVTYKTIDNLSNDNGEYRLDVDIDDNGVVKLTSTYMPYVLGYSWIDDILHIDTTLTPFDYTGIIMSNVNYNSQHVNNGNVIVDTDTTGLLVSNVNYGMGFTLLITISSH